MNSTTFECPCKPSIVVAVCIPVVHPVSQRHRHLKRSRLVLDPVTRSYDHHVVPKLKVTHLLLTEHLEARSLGLFVTSHDVIKEDDHLSIQPLRRCLGAGVPCPDRCKDLRSYRLILVLVLKGHTTDVSRLRAASQDKHDLVLR